MSEVIVREAGEEDISQIKEIFLDVYGDDYPHRSFFDEKWLKRSVFNDDVLVLVAVEGQTILGTASVVFGVGTFFDLLGEFGRLAVSPKARGKGVGKVLMNKRIEFIQDRLHVGIVENRAVHPFSQKISLKHGFKAVGFLPQKHLFIKRESIALYMKHFGEARELRRNHPRIIPEAHFFAHHALVNLEFKSDAIIDDIEGAYPCHRDFEIEDFSTKGMPPLLRIERGRIHHREIFGPARLQYGFFRLTTKKASYLVAKSPEVDGAIAGALGYIYDKYEKSIRIFEMIYSDENCVKFLYNQLMEKAKEWDVEYLETDVSAYSPKMQRTLLEIGFLPIAYMPAAVFHETERLDIIKMAKLNVAFDLGETELTPESQLFCDHVIKLFKNQDVDKNINERLCDIDLFEGLTQSELKTLASHFDFKKLSPMEFIYKEGDCASNLYIILKGEVNLFKGSDKAVCVGTLAEKSALAEISFVNGEKHSVTAQCQDSVELMQIDKESFTSLIRRRPEIGVVIYKNLIQDMGEKLKKLDLEITEKFL